MKARRFWMIAFLSASLLTGCGNQAAQQPDTPPQQTPAEQPADQGHAGHIAHLPNGDLQETTQSISVLPAFLMKNNPKIADVYRIAGENLDMLEYIPCYCGCGTSANHKNNKECFVSRVNEDGSVVWDDHGTRCGTCMEIAVTAAQLKTEGKSLQEIRTIIDEKYAKEYAPPTPTPMPPA